MSVEFPELPYATYALEPFLSAETLGFHYGKHHSVMLMSMRSWPTS